MDINVSTMNVNTMNIYVNDSSDGTPQVPNGRYYMKLESNPGKALYATLNGVAVGVDTFSSSNPAFVWHLGGAPNYLISNGGAPGHLYAPPFLNSNVSVSRTQFIPWNINIMTANGAGSYVVMIRLASNSGLFINLDDNFCELNSEFDALKVLLVQAP